ASILLLAMGSPPACCILKRAYNGTFSPRNPYMVMTVRLFTTLALLSSAVGCFGAAAKPTKGRHDVVIYGGTSAGVTAAIQVARAGKSVVIIEPTKWLGGLTASGLGFVDA